MEARRYDVSTLKASDVARTYAVVQHFLVAPSLQEWQAATATELQRQKWLTVVDTAGVVRGLCYTFVRERQGVRCLEVPIFAAMSLVDQNGVARELFDVARVRAVRLKCDFVHFWRVALREWSPHLAPSVPDGEKIGLIYDLRASLPRGS